MGVSVDFDLRIEKKIYFLLILVDFLTPRGSPECPKSAEAAGGRLAEQAGARGENFKIRFLRLYASKKTCFLLDFDLQKVSFDHWNENKKNIFF